MQEHTNILCYGCSPETIEQIENALPNPMLYVVSTDCATDLIAVPCLMTIIDPRTLSDDDTQMLCNCSTIIGNISKKQQKSRPFGRLLLCVLR